MMRPPVSEQKDLRSWIDGHHASACCFAPSASVPEHAIFGGNKDPLATAEAVACLTAEALDADLLPELVRCALRVRVRDRVGERRFESALSHVVRAIAAEPNEHFLVTWFDAAGRVRRLTRYECHNAADHAWVNVSRLLCDGVLLGAAQCLGAHNHPNGALQASAADLAFHSVLERALSELGIGLLANVVVTPQGVVDIGSGRRLRVMTTVTSTPFAGV